MIEGALEPCRDCGTSPIVLWGRTNIVDCSCLAFYQLLKSVAEKNDASMNDFIIIEDAITYWQIRNKKHNPFKERNNEN